MFEVIILVAMKTILTQKDALEIYNLGSEFVIKTLMEQYNEIEILKRILEANIWFPPMSRQKNS